MRVLFVTWAWPTHLYAMVPLARVCRAAGHPVLVASQPGLQEDIRQAGLPGVSVGQDVDAVTMVRGYLMPSPTNGNTPAGGPRALQMLLAHAESMVDDLVRHALGWTPDIVVFEPTALAGPLVAAAVGVPAVRQLYGVDLVYQARKQLERQLEPLARRHGVDDVDPLGMATIDPAPPGLRVPAAYERHLPMRYVPFNGFAAAGPELPARTSRPRVCVTWGMTMFRLDPGRFLAGQVIAALRDLDLEIIAAVTPEQHPLLPRPIGDNVRIVLERPLHLTLPAGDLLVAHGGAGTVLTGLLHGLPQLLIPQLPDHAGHAARVRAAGAGAVLTRDEATPGRLRTEVLRLLRGTGERTAARRLQQQMRQLPEPAAIVRELERISRCPRDAGVSRP